MGGIWLRTRDRSVIEEQMPPGTAEVFHHHVESQQFFFILSGDAVIEVDGSETR
jgi:mannose-6-phosphate isomerase-like protein (cupin superfamily)